MRKYWIIINTTWQKNLAYRFTIFSYRIGEIASNLILVLMWMSVYTQTDAIKGYSLDEMITYVLIGNLIQMASRNYLSHKIIRDIKDGKLSVFLIRPMRYLSFMFISELGIILLPLIMSLVSQLILVLFFYKHILINLDIVTLLLILAMIMFSLIIELFIACLIGFIAFWTVETEGLSSAIDRLKSIFSGYYFPISLLPQGFITLSYSLPFAYSFFVPTQLYLGKIGLSQGIKGIGVQIAWIFILYIIIKILWRLGLKKYESVGI